MAERGVKGKCPECGRRRLLYLVGGRYSRLCRPCYSRARFERNIGYRYGLTVAEYAWMMYRQGWRCGVCRQEFDEYAEEKRRRPVIDHCHDTGKARGILCPECNLAIGKFKDCPTRLSRAIAYLTAA